MAEAETTSDSDSQLDEEELLELEDELFELEDNLIEMQGTTIRSHDKDEDEEEVEIQKIYTFNKSAEEEEEEAADEEQDIESQLAEFSESMENLQEAKPGQLLAADVRETNSPQFEAGRYTRADKEKKRIFTGRPGQVVWSGNTVHVLPIMHVDGDVDRDYGDIRYDGNIFIEGKVADNQYVEARGNIWVMGTVGRARLKASGDIVIQGGIKGGEKQSVQAHGIVYGRFAENVRIKAGESIIIKEVIMHSQLEADESVILVDSDANIIGGELSVGKRIVTNDLGSVSYPETQVRMGAKGVMQQEMEELESRRDTLVDRVESKEKDVNNLENKKENEGLSPGDEKRLRDLKFELNHAREDLQQVKLRISDIEEELESDVRREILVNGTVFPGVNLHIGSVQEPVEEERNHCTIRTEAKEIKYDSYQDPDEEIDFDTQIGMDLDDYEEKYEIPELEEIRKHVIYEEDDPLFNREDQLRLFLGLNEDQEMALVDLTEDGSGGEPVAPEEEETHTWWGIEVHQGESKDEVRRFFDPNARESVKVRCKSPKKGLEQAAEYFGMDKDDLAVKILEEGKPGFFGIGERDYLIRVIKKDKLEESEADKKEKEETFDLLQQAEQEEDVAGFINFENTEEGLKLTVYPPEGHGLPVSLDQVKEELEENNYDQDIDWVKVEEMVEEKSGETGIIGPRQRNPKIDGSFSVTLNDNETEAYLTVIPPKPEGVPVSREEVENYLEEEEIRYDENKVKEVFEQELFEEEQLIASGKDPEHGKDGQIDYKIPIEVLEEDEEAEGEETVDHREGEEIINAQEGDVLAEVEEPTEGEPGISIYGEEIPPEPGDSVSIDAGENVDFSADGTRLVAQTEGRVRLAGTEDEPELVVEPVLVINGDLDYEVGNVDFEGVVEVGGMILDGFRVDATKRVEAQGVGKAHVKCEGDVVVEQGVVGREEGLIEAGGNVFAKYLENCRVKAGGSVIVEEATMHCQIDAEEYVIIKGKKRGDIIGGVTRAGEAIEAKNIGAKLASKTEVESGISPSIRDKVENLENEITQQKEIMEKVRDGLKGLKQIAENVGGMENLPEDKKELRSKLTNRARAIKNRMESLNDELSEIRREIENMSGGKVLAEETLREGVKLTIQTATMYLTEDSENTQFLLYEGELTQRNYEPLEVDIERPD